MSILIKGMTMPTRCLACPCSGTDCTDDGNEVWVCEASKLRQLTTEDKIERRPEWCPLVPVPPHGRLIDADALRKQMAERRNYVGRLSDPLCLIEDAPTVIEAEGE